MIMGFGKYLENEIESIRKCLDSILFKCDYRVNAKDFSRERKMGFKETVLFILNMTRKSLQLELNGFFENVLRKDFSVRKQSYLAARQKIKPEVFTALNDNMISSLYGNKYESWNGYRLSAIDSSVLEIPNTKELRNEFRFVRNRHGDVARARASCIYDPLNKMIIKCKIDRYNFSERETAMQMILQMLPEKKSKELIIFDRGYPSAKLISFLFESGIDFLMRIQRNYSFDLKQATKKEQYINIKYNEKLYKVRVLRFRLESGEEEILFTSLYDKKFKIKDFKNLYFKRWGIETKFDELKNKLEIENFSGMTKTAIEQDFYATILLSNIIELVRQCKEENRSNRRKYQYKINYNILVGTLKDKFVCLLLIKNRKERNMLLNNIIEQVSKSLVPIRPNRQNPRISVCVRSKYKTNHKRCM